MRTGWFTVDGVYYYASKSGTPQTGWLKSGKSWYYLQADGLMARDGTFSVDGKEYLFTASGAMRTGWISLGGGDYRYADKSGALIRDAWIKSGGKSYYLKSDGLMARSEAVDRYWVNGSGAWVGTWNSECGMYDHTTVYVSNAGKIHRTSDCSGMKHWSSMTLARALSRGYKLCQKCF